MGVGGARERYPKTVTVLEGLINERNTWRLLGKLYTDRLVTAARPPPVLPPPAPRSEKQLIERLFQRSAAVRQAWIVVEWLERNAQDQMEESMMTQLQYFTDSTVAWENTLAALESGSGGPNMVTELDPDAPLRSGKQLHSLDQSDEARLVRALFVLVRCGLLEEGQELCCRVGQVLPSSLDDFAYHESLSRPGELPLWRGGSCSTTPTTRAEQEEELLEANCQWRATSTETSGNVWPGIWPRTQRFPSTSEPFTLRSVEI